MSNVTPKTVFMVFDAAMNKWPRKGHLTGNQVILFAHNKARQGKAVYYQRAWLQVKEEVSKDFITDHVPNQFNMLTEDFNYLIVPDLSAFVAHIVSKSCHQYHIYGGFNVNVGENQQLKLAASYDKMIDELSQQAQGTFVIWGTDQWCGRVE